MGRGMSGDPSFGQVHVVVAEEKVPPASGLDAAVSRLPAIRLGLRNVAHGANDPPAFLDDASRFVRRAVVHDDHLERRRVALRLQRGERAGEIPRAVFRRDHHGKFHDFLRGQIEQRVRHTSRGTGVVTVQPRERSTGRRQPGSIIVRLECDARDTAGRHRSVHFANERRAGVHVRLAVIAKAARNADRDGALERNPDQRNAVEIGQRTVDSDDFGAFSGVMATAGFPSTASSIVLVPGIVKTKRARIAAASALLSTGMRASPEAVVR